MEKLEKYRKFVEEIILKYSQYKPSYGDHEAQVIFDRERDHYLLMIVGWNRYKRTRGCVLQMDIKNDKIWIQHDGTEIGTESRICGNGSSQRRYYSGFPRTVQAQIYWFWSGVEN